MATTHTLNPPARVAADFKDRVVLRLETEFPDLDEDLFTVPETGVVMGTVATDAFETLDDRERLDWLRSVLTQSFSPEEESLIGPTVAMSLFEFSWHRHDDDAACD